MYYIVFIQSIHIEGYVIAVCAEVNLTLTSYTKSCTENNTACYDMIK